MGEALTGHHHEPTDVFSRESVTARIRDLLDRLDDRHLNAILPLVKAMLIDQAELKESAARAIEDAEVKVALDMVRSAGWGEVRLIITEKRLTDVIPSPRHRIRKQGTSPEM